MKRFYKRAETMILRQVVNNGLVDYIVLLFNNAKWNEFVLPGGRINKWDSNLSKLMIDTAQRELCEESLNMFNLSRNVFNKCKHIDIQYDKQKSWGRTFVVIMENNMENLDESVYYGNKIITDNIGDKSWRETDRIGQFYLSDLVKMCHNKNEYQCLDINGTMCKIYEESACNVMKVVQANIINGSCCFNIKIKDNEKYLFGTKSYVDLRLGSISY